MMVLQEVDCAGLSRGVHGLLILFLVATRTIRNSALLVVLVGMLRVGVLVEVAGAELLAVEHLIHKLVTTTSALVGINLLLKPWVGFVTSKPSV